MGCEQRFLFLGQPFRRRHEHTVEPGVGRRVVACVGQGLGVLLLKIAVVRIVGGKLLAELQHLLALAGPLQDVRSRLGPPLHGQEMSRLALIDGPQGVQQPQLLVGLQNIAGVIEEVIGEEEVVATNFRSPSGRGLG